MTRVTEEPPGFTCVNGGLRIETGRDDDGDGVLVPSEVEDSDVICTGSVAQLTRVTAEPAGTNCAEGGARVEVGFDDNGNQALDPGEIDTTSFICTTVDDPTKVVQATADTPLLIDTTAPSSALSATLMTSGPGTVVALYSGQAFCYATECPAQQTPPDSGAVVWLTADATGTLPAAGESVANAYLTQEMSLLIPLQDTYSVSAAGTYTYTVRAGAATAPYQLYDQSLTLVFVPN